MSSSASPLRAILSVTGSPTAPVSTTVISHLKQSFMALAKVHFVPVKGKMKGLPKHEKLRYSSHNCIVLNGWLFL